MADRILTTHAGSLPRPDELADMVWARMDGEAVDEARLEAKMDEAVADLVGKQREVGLDVISDGEMSKPGFSTYVSDRFSGFGGGTSEFQSDDVAPFPELAMKLFANPQTAHLGFSYCVGPVELTDKEAVNRDIARFKSALGDADPSGAFMGTISPGQIAFNYPDQHYGSHEKYLAACADALAHEYRAIIDAGFNLQIDSPDMAMAAHARSVGSSVGDWHHHLPLAVEALNGALDGIPADRVRFHVCWGNTGTPHHLDVPLADIIDHVLNVNAGTIYVEGANPRHAHEMARVPGRGAPRGQVRDPRCDRRQIELRGASASGRRPARAGRPVCRQGPADGRHRLRLRHVHPVVAGRSGRDVVEDGLARRGRRDRVERAVARPPRL
ncbi:MAG: hypothetical protein WB761_21840 [Solirubrobacteraceae bacterium]